MATDNSGDWGGQPVGRQAFEDAQFAVDQDRKIRIMGKAEQEENRYDTVFGVLIILNLLVMGVETDTLGSDNEDSKQAFYVLECCFLVLFIIELLLRLRSHKDWLQEIKERRKQEEEETRVAREEMKRGSVQPLSPYATAPWAETEAKLAEENSGTGWRSAHKNLVLRLVEFWAAIEADVVQHYAWLVFDFVLIAMSAIDVWILEPLVANEGQDANLTALRALRLVRIVRSVKLIRYFKDMFLLVQGLSEAFKTISWVIFLLLVVVYVCALFLTNLVGRDEEYLAKAPEAAAHFNSLGRSMFTLFTVLTLEDWNSISSGLMEVHRGIGIFFVFFILFAHFTVLNLFVGVIVEHIQHISSTGDLEIMRDMKRKQDMIYEKLRELFSLADENGDGMLTIQEFRDVLGVGSAMETLRSLGIRDHEVNWLFDVLDADQSGYLSIDEFVSGVLKCKESERARMMMDMQYRIIKEIRAAQRGDVYKKRGFKTETTSGSGLCLDPAAGSPRGGGGAAGPGNPAPSPELHSPRVGSGGLFSPRTGNGAAPSEAEVQEIFREEFGALRKAAARAQACFEEGLGRAALDVQQQHSRMEKMEDHGLLRGDSWAKESPYSLLEAEEAAKQT